MTDISAKLILSSKNAATGDTLYTFVLTYPRCILSEVNTHRVFSRNTASSRAIPAKKLRGMVLRDPFIPKYVGQNQKGMSAGEEFTGLRKIARQLLYSVARYPAVAAHYALDKLGVHKQIVNRLIEPWMWCQQVLSTTDLNNFFKLRLHAAAEPHMAELAYKMAAAVEVAKEWPDSLQPGETHMPFISWEDRAELNLETLKKVSAARCARVSYLLPETGKRSDLARDLELHDRLASSGHYSPFEHVATAISASSYVANFRGFRQYRRELEGENGE